MHLVTSSIAWFLPDKAIDIIDEAGAYVDINRENYKEGIVDEGVIEEIISKICHIPKQTIENTEIESLKILKSELKKNIFGQNQAIEEVTKIHITAGKKKKIRNIDIVGAFSNLEELTGEDIGIIDVQDGHSFVDILNGKGNLILKRYKEIRLKGKVAKLSKAKN